MCRSRNMKKNQMKNLMIMKYKQNIKNKLNKANKIKKILWIVKENKNNHKKERYTQK